MAKRKLPPPAANYALVTLTGSCSSHTILTSAAGLLHMKESRARGFDGLALRCLHMGVRQ